MTLTELKYIVAVAREKHFGRAAESCFVSQPTLSVAIKKLEEELGVSIFERANQEVWLTDIGQKLITQAQIILEESANFKRIAQQGHDPLKGPLKVGIIYTVAPYLLPYLIPIQMQLTPQMPLILQENFTTRLLELLHQGEIDCAIMALPINDNGIETALLYEEDFVAAVPVDHAFAQRHTINGSELKDETMLLLGIGHCFRDQVLDVCPEMSQFSSSTEGIQRSFEASSLETIRHMVAAGLGITLLPASAVNLYADQQIVRDQGLLRFVRLEEPAPQREIVLCWRKSYTRLEAIESLIQAIKHCHLPGVTMDSKSFESVVAGSRVKD
ncbi:LysR substrate-binding domain-containing protein [Brackiella oedipodis]|uniref:LysR substrate-binding domain-containing protein n=1 Tax=Brackiella oedipodis TaxID=124225 RepID=UPI000491A7A9|nr:LysR substrate-binding domain-containing protein [Brackiella oedipodis]